MLNRVNLLPAAQELYKSYRSDDEVKDRIKKAKKEKDRLENTHQRQESAGTRNKLIS